MEQSEPADAPATPTHAIAGRIRDLRRRRAWSAAQLAVEMSKVGVQWSRGVVAKLENGTRDYVTVEELLALARVLDVAPLHLLVPVDGPPDAPYRVAPGLGPQPVAAVRDWIRGIAPIEGVDERRYATEVPVNEWRQGPFGGVHAAWSPEIESSTRQRQGEDDGER